MPVKVRCPSCEKVLNVPDTARGKAVKCPGCEGRVPVPAESAAAAAPAGAAKTAAKAAPVRKKADDEDSFLTGLDLSKAEDSSVKACKKCGAKLDEEDEECPKCGTMVGTGQLSKAARKARQKGRGPDQDLFYKYLFSDAWTFYKKNLGLSIRSSMYSVIFAVLYILLAFLGAFCINPPPKLFAWVLAGLCALVPLGWMWFLMTEIIKGTMEKKEKLKRVNFDLFLCIALGLKSILWMIVFLFPVLVITAILVVVIPGPKALVFLGVFLGLMLLWMVLVPPALTHMAMPVQARGWLFFFTAQILSKTWKPSLMVCLVYIIVMLPVGLINGTVNFFTREYSPQAVVAVTQLRSLTLYLKHVEAANKKDKSAADQLPNWVDISDLKEHWVKILLGFLAYMFTAGTAPLFIVYCMRPLGQLAYYFRKDLDLVTSAPEVVYKARAQGHDVAVGNPLQMGLTITGVLVLLPFLAAWVTFAMTKGIMAGIVAGVVVGAIALPFALAVAGLYVILEKAGESGATMFVPIYGYMQIAKVAGRPAWWGLIGFLWPVICIDIAKRFNKGPLYGIGCIVLPYIFFPLLGFSSAVYDDGTRRSIRSDDDDDDDDDDDEDDED